MPKREVERKWDPALEVVMKTIQSKKGCKIKSANEVGKKKVDYFRGKDLTSLLLRDDERIRRRLVASEKAFLGGKKIEDEADCAAIGAELMNNGFIARAVYAPLSGANSDSKKKSWPDRLQRLSNSQGYDPFGYYIITYEGAQGMQYFLLSCIIGCVLLGCLFPVWPFWARIGAWYVLVIFLSIYFGMELTRLVCFIMFWVIGVDFWIFPNINDESLGVLDSFRPLHSWVKRKDGFGMIFVRLFALCFIAIATEQISRTHSLSDVKDLVTGSYEDIFEWGRLQLTALPGGTDIPSLAAIDEELLALEEEERQERLAADKAEAEGGPTADAPKKEEKKEPEPEEPAAPWKEEEDEDVEETEL